MKKALSVGVVVLALFVGACSKSADAPPSDGNGTTATGGSSAEEYVTTLCTSLSAWLTTVQEQAASQTAPESMKDAKTQIQGFIKAMVDATDSMISELNAQGAPDVDGGGAAHVALTGALSAVSDALAAAQDSADSISTTNEQQFQSQITAIQGQIETSASNVSTALNGLSNPDLDKAAAESPACTEMMTQISEVPTPSP